MTLADFARKSNVSRAAITQLIKRGRLRKNADGGIDEDDELAREYITTVKRQRRQALRKKERESPKREVPAKVTPKKPAVKTARERRVDNSDETEGESFTEAERRDKIAAANLKEQKLAITRGELLPRDQVKLILSRVYAVHRAQLKTLSERMGPEIAAVLGAEDRALVVQSMIDEDTTKVLEQIKSDLYAYLESIGDGEELRGGDM